MVLSPLGRAFVCLHFGRLDTGPLNVRRMTQRDRARAVISRQLCLPVIRSSRAGRDSAPTLGDRGIPSAPGSLSR
jgi:hypothetical protein